MLELADRMVSKTIVSNGVWVQVPLPAPYNLVIGYNWVDFTLICVLYRHYSISNCELGIEFFYALTGENTLAITFADT